MEKHVVTTENAERIALWLRTRGGIAIWESINMSNPGASWTTPATHEDGTPATKPTWQASDTPRIITDPADVLVSKDEEVKRFHIAVRMGSQGLTLKVTDAGSARIRREVKKAGKGAYHIFDYDEAVIMKPVSQVPLNDYLAVKWPSSVV